MPDVAIQTKLVILLPDLNRFSVINLSWGAFLEVMAGAVQVCTNPLQGN